MIVTAALVPSSFVAVMLAVVSTWLSGVPLMTPVSVSIKRPLGNPEAAQLVGVFDAAMACEKATPAAMMRGLVGAVMTGMAMD
jgi:hypothetical protein